jgi:mitosis inhibitor protein kinase SWE1
MSVPVSTPTPHTRKSKPPAHILPRLSLPAFAAPKVHRTLHHRQSHPAAPTYVNEDEDLFEQKFVILETLGKGQFSTVLKVQDRYGEGIYAVKKARGLFDGIKDRLRHLEEVDALRHLSLGPRKSHPNVIRFIDAWEQNRQLYIQTEVCLGSLAFFLEEYGRVVERLDEGRVWKIVRELADVSNSSIPLMIGTASYSFFRSYPFRYQTRQYTHFACWVIEDCGLWSCV